MHLGCLASHLIWSSWGQYQVGTDQVCLISHLFLATHVASLRIVVRPLTGLFPMLITNPCYPPSLWVIFVYTTLIIAICKHVARDPLWSWRAIRTVGMWSLLALRCVKRHVIGNAATPRLRVHFLRAVLPSCVAPCTNLILVPR